MRRARWLCLCLLAVLGWGASATAAPPTDPAAPSDTTVPGDTSVPASSAGSDTTLATGELPPALGPLVVVPSGCVVPAPARAVFVGELSNTDQPPTTARFRLVRVLAGNLDGYASGGLVDVHYGGEAHFLTIGVRYIVGVVVDATTGLLVSTVSEPAPLFGGDAVIGANDSDVKCPRVEDPARTLQADGTSVETGVLAPLEGEGKSILLAVLRPLGVALAVLLLLVAVKHLLFAVGRSLRDISRAEPAAASAAGRRHHPASVATEQSGA